MAGFGWVAVDRAGRRHRGFSDSPTQADLKRLLRERGLLLVTHDGRRHEARRASWRAGNRSLVEMTRAVASLLETGMPVTQALSTAAAVSPSVLSSTLAAVRHRVERGGSVADSLADHPRLFDPLYVGAVRAGERGSDLAGAFSRLAAFTERQEEVRQRIISASIYPAILAAVGGVALTAMLLFVVPRFVELVSATGASLPPTTALLVRASSILRDFWPIVLLGSAVACAALLVLFQSSVGRHAASAVLLRMPVIGPVRREVLGARLARLLALLLRGGTSLVPALEAATDSIADPRAALAITRVRTRVRQGESLNVALGELDVFPALLCRLVAVGEEAGRVVEFLDRAAIMLEERTHRRMERMVALLEPAMIVAFGGMVAVVAFSLLQVVYGLNAGGFR